MAITLLVAAVIFVLAVRDDARGRGDRQERLLDLHAVERGLEIVDVARELRLPGIGDGRDANRIHPGRDLFMRVELGIELGEALSIGAALKWIGTGLDRTAFEAAQPFERVLRPADRFPEFAVADHIDAGFGLAANDGGDRLGQARLVGVRVERFARLLRAQECLQRLGPDQAADMGGEDSVAAAFHLVGSTFDGGARLLAEVDVRGQSARNNRL